MMHANLQISISWLLNAADNGQPTCKQDYYRHITLHEIFGRHMYYICICICKSDRNKGNVDEFNGLALHVTCTT